MDKETKQQVERELLAALKQLFRSKSWFTKTAVGDDHISLNVEGRDYFEGVVDGTAFRVSEDELLKLADDLHNALFGSPEYEQGRGLH